MTFFVAGRIKEDELFGVRDGKALEKNLAHDGEDGGVGADAESQGEDGDGREGGGFFEEAKGETSVLEKGFDERKRLLIAHAFFDLFQAAQFEECLAAGFFGEEACAEVVVDVKLEVAESSVSSSLVELVFCGEDAKAEECGAEIHGWTSFELRRNEF